MNVAAKSQTLTSQNGLLQIHFTWREDRFHHVVQKRSSNGEWVTIAQSIEGTSEQSWPPSPPFQEVETHIGGNGMNCLLAIGLAGTSHWSAAIEEIAEPADSPLPGSQVTRIRFDLACRMKKAADTLGSGYCASTVMKSTKSDRVMLCEDQTAWIEAAAGSLIATSPSEVSVRPATIPDGEPTTARWMYDFVIATSVVD